MLNNEVITSRNNPIVRYAASLADKKSRKAERSFLVEGVKLTLEAINDRLPITHILIRASTGEALVEAIEARIAESGISDVKIFLLGDSAFEKISTEKAPQGVITIIKYLDFLINPDIIYKEEILFSQNERVLALCSVRDPANLGAIIRTAAAFGINHIILSDDCADVYSPKTLRSSMGGIFKLKISTVSDLTQFIAAAKKQGRRVYAAELSRSAISLRDISLSVGDIVLIGNEGHGIPDAISACCTGSIYIPIAAGVESLNASVAAAVFMWEQSKL